MGREFEIIIVDGCSLGDTWQVLKREERETLWILRLLKNSGEHNALLSVFSLAKGSRGRHYGRWPPNALEDFPKLVEAADEGYGLVISVYAEKKHSKARNLGGMLVDVTCRLPADQIPGDDRPVVENVVVMGGVFRM